ncbi:MAG: VirB8/TrbF family protein [Pseudomonadota bacterium]|nr:VirB8/TrbF family protein [Pseudomonadota bacterium]
MIKDPALQAYLSEAASWDADRMTMNERSVRVAWRIAFAASVLAATAIVALMMLIPLKRVEPFVVRVDNTTGIVDVVPVYAGDAQMPEAVTRYFLDHYITVCERFNFSTAESDYEECGSFHTPQRNQLWYAAWAKTNPESPLNVYKDGATVRAQVTSVSFFTRSDGVADVAQVRYVKAKRQAGGTDEQRTHWIATVRYAFTKPSSEPATRRWNPLGFKIVDFRPEPEALTEGPGSQSSLVTQTATNTGDLR